MQAIEQVINAPNTDEDDEQVHTEGDAPTPNLQAFVKNNGALVNYDDSADDDDTRLPDDAPKDQVIEQNKALHTDEDDEPPATPKSRKRVRIIEPDSDDDDAPTSSKLRVIEQNIEALMIDDESDMMNSGEQQNDFGFDHSVGDENSPVVVPKKKKQQSTKKRGDRAKVAAKRIPTKSKTFEFSGKVHIREIDEAEETENIEPMKVNLPPLPGAPNFYIGMSYKNHLVPVELVAGKLKYYHVNRRVNGAVHFRCCNYKQGCRRAIRCNAFNKTLVLTQKPKKQHSTNCLRLKQ